MSRAARGRGGRWALLLALAFLLGFAGDATAVHDGLRRSSPAAGAVLDAAPRELRLTFTRAVDPSLARIELIDPTGRAVDLSAPVAHRDSANVLVVSVTGRLRAGAYTVRWRIVGSDGHPVQGTFGFVISEGATGLAATELDGEAFDEVAHGVHGGADATGGAGPGPVAPGGGDAVVSDPSSAAESSPRSFGVSSPAYVAVRWFTFLCLIGLIGCVAFRVVVLGAVEHVGSAVAAVVAPASDRARVIGMALGWALLVAAAFRLVAQAAAIGGLDAGVMRTLVTGTAWGAGWILQVAGTTLALVGFGLARARGVNMGWRTAILAVVALAVTPALSGHAVASQGSAGVAVLADALHVVGAGGWLGTLALIVAAGIPAALGLDSSLRGAAVAAMVRAFSPAALAFAGLLAATGIYASALHLGSVAALFDSSYGRTFLLKLAAIVVAVGLGAYNLFRVKPTLGDDAGIAKLRRSSTAELVAGTIVLVATALLVATPPAAHAPAADEPTSEVAAPVGAATDAASLQDSH